MAAPKSKLVVYAAITGNTLVAITKFIAAWLTGSSAMLSEAVHSVVDTSNQLLLLHGIHRAEKPPDGSHPLGYGRELYFWSFVVAVLVFALGAGVSIYEGIIHIANPEEAVSPFVAYGVLLVAFLLEGWLTIEAFRDFKKAKGPSGWIQAVRQSKDPPAFIVLLENGAARAGIIAAAIGLMLSQLTGNPFFDGAASIVIGTILAFTALLLAYESKGLLIGEAADPALVDSLHQLACSQAGVVGVGDVLTVHSSPDQITVMMNVDFRDDMPAGEVERIVCSVEQDARTRWPQVRRLFVRPMQGAAALRRH
jgi:cation diffusion facilitator family transporter